MKEKILVTQAQLPDFNEFMNEIESIWNNHWLTNNGEKSQELAKRLVDYLQVPEISLFTNGHLALELAIQAFGLSGEIITTPYTFASTTHAIVRNGLTPVFCDINPDDFTMDVTKIESLITDKTSAILPVHVYGNICNVEEIERIAKKYDLKVIYDAAHAFGEKYKGIGIGNFGEASMFSFHATKVFNTIEGGAVTYSNSNSDLGWTLSRLRNFGIKDEATVDWVGSNAKMNEFQAAMGLCNLRHLDENIAKRKSLVEHYRKNLEGIPGVQLNIEQEDVQSNYAYFPIVVHEKEYGKSRNELDELLKEQGIFPRKYFYPITSQFECYHGEFNPFLTPIALSVSKRVLTLPLYSELEIAVVEKICAIIKKNRVK